MFLKRNVEKSKKKMNSLILDKVTTMMNTMGKNENSDDEELFQEEDTIRISFSN